jgi:hypothetical protein
VSAKQRLDQLRRELRTDAPDAGQLGQLVHVPAIGQGRDVVVDARLPALAVAAALIRRKAPLLVVVLGAAGTAALLRQAGL